MKSRWHLIIAVTALLGSLWCVFLLAYSNFPLQTQTRVDIIVEDPRRDVGVLRQKEKKSIVYTLKNNTEYPIVLGSVKTSCSCAASSLSSWDLPVGGTIDMVLLFDAGQMRGNVSGSATYLYAIPNLKKNGGGAVTFEAIVESDYDVLPAELEFDINDGDVLREVVVLSESMEKRIRIVEVTPTRDWFDLEVETMDEGQQSGLVRVKFVQDKWNQIEKEAALLIRTNSDLQPEFYVKMKINIAEK